MDVIQNDVRNLGVTQVQFQIDHRRTIERICLFNCLPRYLATEKCTVGAVNGQTHSQLQGEGPLAISHQSFAPAVGGDGVNVHLIRADHEIDVDQAVVAASLGEFLIR